MADDLRTITLPGGIAVPVPRWTASAFGVVAVVAISFGVYRYFYPVTPELVTAQQANAQLALEVRHYNAHMFETPEAMVAGDALSVRVFSDDCLVIARKSSTRLLVAAAPHEGSAFLPSLDPVVLAADEAGGCGHQGGSFTWQYGARLDACWIEVVRTFSDGCSHVQHLNTCSGAFENAVRWTRCNH